MFDRASTAAGAVLLWVWRRWYQATLEDIARIKERKRARSKERKLEQAERARDQRELASVEEKVWMSDPILRRDLDILARHDSELLESARNLREKQLLSGRHPESLPRMG